MSNSGRIRGPANIGMCRLIAIVTPCKVNGGLTYVPSPWPPSLYRAGIQVRHTKIGVKTLKVKVGGAINGMVLSLITTR